jgi:hypothetical protein
MDRVKFLLPFALALIMSSVLFTVDSTAYQNAANEVDANKAYGTFFSLWILFTAILKMNPPSESV